MLFLQTLDKQAYVVLEMLISFVLAEIGFPDPYFSTNSTSSGPHSLFVLIRPPPLAATPPPPPAPPSEAPPDPSTTPPSTLLSATVPRTNKLIRILSLLCAVSPPSDTPRMSSTAILWRQRAHQPRPGHYDVYHSCVQQHKSCLDKLAKNGLSANLTPKWRQPERH